MHCVMFVFANESVNTFRIYWCLLFHLAQNDQLLITYGITIPLLYWGVHIFVCLVFVLFLFCCLFCFLEGGVVFVGVVCGVFFLTTDSR